MGYHESRITRLEAHARRPESIPPPMTDEEQQAEEEWQTEALLGILNNPFIAEGAESRLHPSLSPGDHAHAEKMLAEERERVAEILAPLALGEARGRQAGESVNDGPLAS